MLSFRTRPSPKKRICCARRSIGSSSAGQEKSLMDRIKKILGEQSMSPPDLKDIEKQLGVNRNKLTEVIRLLERDRSVIRVATDLYYLSSTVDQIRAVLKKFLSDKGEIT